ncbi:MAG: hypothetical protein CW691_03410 [Candidatus Bathyarchaeum sp.]|nr:MAG: hypothetical protein CW691_03410 [Candidatus Bathyarchaeum sp.]
MKKSRSSAIKDIVNPVRQLITSDKFFLTKIVHNFPFQEPLITRCLAFSIDYILLFFVTGLLKDLVFPTWIFSFIDYMLMAGVLSFFYFAITESILGYTIGKRLFYLKVVSVTGDKPEFKNVLIRNISKIFFVFLILDIIGSYFTTDKLHQRYIDEIAHTTVEKW